MALRLAGEPCGVLRGADALGWLRQVAAWDALPGLRVDQQGTGRIVDFQDGGASKLHILDGGRVVVADSIEVGNIPASGANALLRLPYQKWLSGRTSANTSDVDLVRVDGDKVELGSGSTVVKTATALEVGAAPALSGAFRAPSGGALMARNAANSADLAAAVIDGSNNLQLGANGTGNNVASIILGSSSVVNDVLCRWRVDALNGIKNSGGNFGGAVKLLEGVSYPYAAKSANYTATTNDYYLAADASGAGVTITLPSAVSAEAGFTLVIKKADSSGNAVTVSAQGGQTVDGAGSYTLAALWKFVAVISDGANWHVIGAN
jgi:hypothetical protein